MGINFLYKMADVVEKEIYESKSNVKFYYSREERLENTSIRTSDRFSKAAKKRKRRNTFIIYIIDIIFIFIIFYTVGDRIKEFFYSSSSLIEEGDWQYKVHAGKFISSSKINIIFFITNESDENLITDIENDENSNFFFIADTKDNVYKSSFNLEDSAYIEGNSFISKEFTFDVISDLPFRYGGVCYKIKNSDMECLYKCLDNKLCQDTDLDISILE